jgi:hypothetical protein
MIVFLNGDGNARIGGQILAVTRVWRRKKIETQVLARVENRGGPGMVIRTRRQSHGIMGFEIAKDLLL